ncbi:MAG: hypothetical protein ABIN94_00330 [Ferruginibacter sp.]
MNAIQRYHYNRLRELLTHLQKESKVLSLPVEHQDELNKKEGDINQLYTEYQSSLLQVAQVINRYEQEQQSVKALVTSHKNLRKKALKKTFCKKLF